MRIRLLPVAILSLTLMLGTKLGGLWTGWLDAGVQTSLAQQAQPVPSANAPAPAPADVSGPGGAASTAEGKAEPEAAPKPKARTASLPADPTLFTQAEIDLLQKLADRRTELEKWASEIEMREGLLKAAEQRIDRKVGELRQIQVKLQGMLKTYEEEQEAKLKSLVKIYESMKPKDAARIFMELEMPVLLDVVERMREAKAAAIIARLEPVKAKDVTAELAARRKLGAEAKAKLSAGPDGTALPSSGNPPPRTPGNG